ncbi:hypothetical protein GCM10022419_063860 [Nonomuraea rosea]|jgi:hypothetical protein|uniref:Uncharacterized protein n=1 Tax=Nonomuraea rosea TaxID=638574 RepID=A0ABP6XXF3_9ACTN
MSDQHIDPAGNTQAFRAFANAREQEAAAAAKPKKSPLLPIIAVVLAIVIIGVAAFLLLK